MDDDVRKICYIQVSPDDYEIAKLLLMVDLFIGAVRDVTDLKSRLLNAKNDVLSAQPTPDFAAYRFIEETYLELLEQLN